MVAFGDQTAGLERALVFEAVRGPGALFGGEEGGSVGEIIKEEEGSKGDDYGQEAFKDESGWG